jgi:transposase
MSESMALVGLDVHQAQSVAAVLDPVTGELSVERLRGAPAVVVPGFLEALGRPVRAVYEAGPTGFGLARAATAAGLDVRVVRRGRSRGRRGIV